MADNSVYGYGGGQSDWNTGTPYGAWGDAGGGYGVIGTSNGGPGVLAWCSAEDGVALHAVHNSNGKAGLFDGQVEISGMLNIGGSLAVRTSMPSRFWGPVTVDGLLTKSGGGFRIDHPLDPANKYLAHSFVESPDMKNLYDGVATLDATGTAVVELPDWFEALNRDFCYQLTPIGAADPYLHVAEEISGKRFKISGSIPGQRVCWQVTGIRQDSWANANRLQVETEKPAPEQEWSAELRSERVPSVFRMLV